jgi:flagellar basal-body rod protein FlgF
MLKGLYQSASAMLPRLRQQEAIANNLANASSPGFRKDMIFTQELTRAQARHKARQTDWEQPMIDQVYTSFEQGSLDKTDNPLNLALEGDGFFVYETEAGDKIYSRAGGLAIDPQGFLVNPEGHRLQGEGGPINVGPGNLSISESGQVEVDSIPQATIQVVDFDDKSVLQKAGSTGFMIPEGIEPSAAVHFAIRQGYLETANVEIIQEMVNMIISFRNYEADAQAARAQDESLEKLIANVGRIR